MLGTKSIPLHSHQIASASFQALPIKQFVCGTPRQERQRQAHLLDTRLRSCLWHSRFVASASSQARTIEQFVCGTPRPERQAGSFTGHTDSVTFVAFSPDGQLIGSSSYDRILSVW